MECAIFPFQFLHYLEQIFSMFKAVIMYNSTNTFPVCGNLEIKV